ncbi:MAG: phenylacetate-CoA oxygenase subunit PaaC, partial [Chloroflexi bacterium]|nr:phenylacetate-CoA oxygenase subunit PaaC [Chloroflexota bacterium]
MNHALQTAISHKLLTLADDELILAHRNSEWTGHGPILEEDVAFTNIALDEMGHAAVWYHLRQDLTGEDADTAAFFRSANEFRNVQMVELPIGDWAFSMLRQYLFDVYEMVHLAALADGSYPPLAAAAAKIRMEEVYHLRHTQSWVRWLGLGTEESQQRMQAALNELWPYAQQLFMPLSEETLLVAEAVCSPGGNLHDEWWQLVTQYLADSGLEIPQNNASPANGRHQHTPHLTTLLNEM